MSEQLKKDPVFDNDSTSEDKNIFMLTWEFWGMKASFPLPLLKQKPEIDPLEVARKLLDDYGSNESIEKTGTVIHIHRVLENTRARRRLERWAKHVIVGYLLIVLAIVISNYLYIPQWHLPILRIPGNIMIAILTTTTANIIGLGLIVLRGHFLPKEKSPSGD